ncbi:MAG: MAPEG family protein [Pseudomonadota bacterium]
MTHTGIALLTYASWTLLLVMALGTLRTLAVLGGGRAANSFSASGDDMPGFGQRLTRAHANCYENLPIAGAILLYAIATDQTAATDGLAYAFVGARVAQSLVHIVSTSNIMVLLRFAFFGVQLAILVFWLLKLFHHI